MSAPQRDFHADPSDQVLFLAANKIGKTVAGGNTWWGLTTDTHPHMELAHPFRMMIAMPDLENAWADDVCLTLKEYEPPGILAPGCKYVEGKGYLFGGRRGILTTHGDRLMPRSSTQDIKAIAGTPADILWVNEPFAQHAQGELFRSVSTSQGKIIVTLTAAQDPRKPIEFGFFRDMVNENPDEWSVHTAPLLPEMAPHRAPHGCPGGEACVVRGGDCAIQDCSIRTQLKRCAPWDVEQRIWAKWNAPALDRWIKGFDSRRHVVDGDTVIPAGVSHLHLTMDHGERPGAQTAHLIARWEHEGRNYAHVWGEYISPGRTTTDEDAALIDDVLRSRGVSLRHVKRGTGDTNTAGKDSEHRKQNQAMEHAFARIVTGNPAASRGDAPFVIVAPDKRPGSREHGCSVLHQAFLDDRLTIDPECPGLRGDLETWKGGKSGADGDRSHTIDDVRYDLAGWLDETDYGHDRRGWRKTAESRGKGARVRGGRSKPLRRGGAQ